MSSSERARFERMAPYVDSTGADWGGYPVNETALRHGAGVEKETREPKEAYAVFPESKPARYGEGWLP